MNIVFEWDSDTFQTDDFKNQLQIEVTVRNNEIKDVIMWDATACCARKLDDMNKDEQKELMRQIEDYTQGCL